MLNKSILLGGLFVCVLLTSAVEAGQPKSDPKKPAGGDLKSSKTETAVFPVTGMM
ncbi:MAG TPA: hypothetical protein VEK08_21980 [Planctomycetota bacterium]|nr:hypothetical protein [Planctomycetota bacterium]